jgi:ribonuclease VapC
MVIDTSALVAIALHEPSRESLLDAIRAAVTRTVSSVSLLEAGIVLRARSGQPGVQALYDFLENQSIETVVFDEAQAKLAVAAFARFGKGMGHRAQLNFGDCAVYGLAAMRGEPLLATGSDFAATDLTVIGPTSGSCGGTRADGV